MVPKSLMRLIRKIDQLNGSNYVQPLEQNGFNVLGMNYVPRLDIIRTT